MAPCEPVLVDLPDAEAIRREALRAGGSDPVMLRFRVVEYECGTGELLGVPVQNLRFHEAIEKTRSLILSNSASHFQVEPVGYLQ